MSDAIRLFLRKVVEQEGLPFLVRKASTTTIAAIIEARERAHEHFDSSEGFFGALESTAKQETIHPS